MTQPFPQRFGCYIGNIDQSVTLDVLRQVFAQCGTIIDASLNGRDADPYRYGFIDFATEEDRARAMKYNGFTLAGRKIKVGISKGNVGRPEGFNSTTGGPNASNSNSGNNNNSNNNHNSGGGGNSNSNNSNSNNNNASQAAPAPPPPPQMPAPPMPANFMTGFMQQQQQQSAQLLLQLIQQGTIDVNNLTPDQQQLLMTSLLQQQAVSSGVPPMLPAAPMAFPPMQTPWAPPRGAFPPAAPTGRPAPFTRGPANPTPSEETVKLREVQRKQYLDVVQQEAERYERKLRERHPKEGRAPSASGSEDGSSDDEGKQRHARPRHERSERHEGHHSHAAYREDEEHELQREYQKDYAETTRRGEEEPQGAAADDRERI